MASSIAYPNCPTDATRSALPQLDISYASKVDSFVARTQMDTGEFRNRQRYSNQLETVNAKLKLNHQQMDFWVNWVLWTLSNGTLSFNIPLPVGGSNNDPFVTKEVTILGGKYGRKQIGHLFWEVRFILEYDDPSTLSPDIFSVYTDLGDPSDPCDTFDLAAFEAASSTFDNYTRNILPVHMELA